MKSPHLSVFKNAVSFFKNHGKHLSSILFVASFIIDFAFLPGVTHPLTPVIGILYALGFGGALFARSYLLTKAKGDVFTNKLSSVLSILLAFFSGSLLSYIFVLYYRSSYLAGAVPFFLFALFVIFANEYIKSKKYRTYLDVSVFYFTVTALSLFLFPFLFHSVSNIVFLYSLTVAFFLSIVYTYLLISILPKELVQKKILYAITLWAPCAFAFLYSTESIPPLPLSITSAAIYQSVEKIGNEYHVTEEVRDGVSTTLHIREGKTLYFFTTIFAPALIKAPIEHVWELYNEETGSWNVASNVSFNVVGGREEGYRGYSMQKTTPPGRWRVSVYLDNKRLIGRHYFSLESADPKAVRDLIR